MTATDTEAALLAAIRENPGDIARRMVYADALADAGRELEAAIQRTIAEPGEDRWRLAYADELERTAGAVACEACKGCGKIGIGNNGNPYMATCDECHGTGRVSDGRAELAEFIRVQVELAVEHSDCGTKGYGPCGKRCEELRTRERELAVEIDSAFGELPLYWTTDQIPLAKGIIVRRGLPAVVRCTLAEWMGGECQNCGGFGEFRRRYDNGDGPEGPCPDCGGKWNSGPHDDPDDYWDKGTGLTPGIGPRLAQRWPIVRVEATDDPLHLPNEITNRFPPGHYTPDQFRSTLSDALIAWARSQPIGEGRS